MSQTLLAATPQQTPTDVNLAQEELSKWFETRNVTCPDGFEVVNPQNVKTMSNDLWTLYTCSKKFDPLQDPTPSASDFQSAFTKVASVDKIHEWTISHHDFDWAHLNTKQLTLYRWSQDGEYLFLIPRSYPGGDGGSALGAFYNNDYLYRLDLNTGQFESILPLTENGIAYFLAPNDRTLAYYNYDDPGVIHIRDLFTNIEKKIVLNRDYVNVGAFAWSMDSNQVFFAGGLDGWNEGTGGITVFMLTIKNMYLLPMFTSHQGYYVPDSNYSDPAIAWKNNALLKLISLNVYSREAEWTNPGDFYLDIRSGKVIDLATPQPNEEEIGTPSP
jgi:hypothetical protein